MHGRHFGAHGPQRRQTEIAQRSVVRSDPSTSSSSSPGRAARPRRARSNATKAPFALGVALPFREHQHVAVEDAGRWRQEAGHGLDGRLGRARLVARQPGEVRHAVDFEAVPGRTKATLSTSSLVDVDHQLADAPMRHAARRARSASSCSRPATPNRAFHKPMRSSRPASMTSGFDELVCVPIAAAASKASRIPRPRAASARATARPTTPTPVEPRSRPIRSSGILQSSRAFMRDSTESPGIHRQLDG